MGSDTAQALETEVQRQRARGPSNAVAKHKPSAISEEGGAMKRGPDVISYNAGRRPAEAKLEPNNMSYAGARDEEAQQSEQRQVDQVCGMREQWQQEAEAQREPTAE